MSAGRDEELRDLAGLEERLRRWRPETGGLSRERMLFEVGLAVGRRRGDVLCWRGGVLAASLLAGLLAIGWLQERGGRERAELALAEAGKVLERSQAGPRESEFFGRSRDQVVEPYQVEPSSYLAFVRGLDTGGRIRPTVVEESRDRNPGSAEAREPRVYRAGDRGLDLTEL